MSSLICECGMDKFAKIKMVVVHGDGFLPYYPKRQDMAFRDGRDGAKLKGDFSSYIPKFYYETVVSNADMLDFLATKTSFSHIFKESDYPFGEKNTYRFIRRSKKLLKLSQNAILGRDAARLLGVRI